MSLTAPAKLTYRTLIYSFSNELTQFVFVIELHPQTTSIKIGGLKSHHQETKIESVSAQGQQVDTEGDLYQIKLLSKSF